jgi:hypothetical protein
MIVRARVPFHPLQAVILVAVSAFSRAAGDPVRLRAAHFTVPPSTGPVTHVIVKNLLQTPWNGTVGHEFPPGWRVTPAARPVTLGSREQVRVPFTIERGEDRPANVYPVTVTAEGGGARVTRNQDVFCTSAPYFRPAIDGDLSEWNDAIPVTFHTGGKKTVIRTYWNKRYFCLTVEVEEEELIGYRTRPAGASFDAVQFQVAPGRAGTPAAAAERAVRYEFLVAASASLLTDDRCFVLVTPESTLACATHERPLGPLECATAKAAVKRTGTVTQYECAIPFRVMPGITPQVGREIAFSVLVHDPGGTGVRDLGAAAGLSDGQRSPLAWCSWRGARWGELPPCDGKIEWGLCSSKK